MFNRRRWRWRRPAPDAREMPSRLHRRGGQIGAADGDSGLSWCWPYVLKMEKTKAMTKADLIEEVSRVAELTRKDSEVIVETIFDSVVRTLRSGDKIEIRGFGSFRTRQRKPRVGRNPKTGDRVEVPPKKIPFFKPSKELKDMVNRDSNAAPAQVAAEAASAEPAPGSSSES
jgi:integration host factor subunit beta